MPPYNPAIQRRVVILSLLRGNSTCGFLSQEGGRCKVMKDYRCTLEPKGGFFLRGVVRESIFLWEG